MNGKNTRLLSRGFTIVELLIVIVVIGVLATITLISYNGITARAKTTQALSNVKSVQNVVEMYNAQYGHYPDKVASFSTALPKLPANITLLTNGTTLSAANGANSVLWKYDGAVGTSTGGTIQYWDFSKNNVSTNVIHVGTGLGTTQPVTGGVVSVLVVGGGGGGDGGWGDWEYVGSGGAGGIVNYSSSYSVTGSITVTVGGGGGAGGVDECGYAGGSSSFGTITSAGGNGSYGCYGPYGGDNELYSGGTVAVGTLTGAGGAGSAGNGYGIDGGPGTYSLIRGTGNVGYGGGGGSAVWDDGNYWIGNVSAGGGVSNNLWVDASSGGTNTGGGGGGAWYAYGGAGGSGIVIVSYPSVSMSATSNGTITYTDSNNQNPRSTSAYSGGYTIHTFTGNGTFTVL